MKPRISVVDSEHHSLEAETEKQQQDRHSVIHVLECADEGERITNKGIRKGTKQRIKINNNFQ